MGLAPVPAVILHEVFLIDLFEVVEVVGAFGVYALVDGEVLPVLFGARAFPQCGQRSFSEEKRLSAGENLAAQTLQAGCPLEPLFLCRNGFGASQRGHEHSSGMSHSERRLTGRIFLP